MRIYAKGGITMDYEIRFYHFVKEAYNRFVIWKRLECELKRKLGVYLESTKEIYLEDKEKLVKIQKVEENLKDFSLNVRWQGEEDYITNDLSECDNAKCDIRYVLKYIDENLNFKETYLFSWCEKADFAQADFENQAKLAATTLKQMQKSGEQLSKTRCDMKLLIVLYFYFRLTPVWLNSEDYANKAKPIENVTFPKSKIYQDFLMVFDAKKNPGDYCFQDKETRKKFGNAHEKNSRENKYWREISNHVIKHHRL